jgi:acetolactate synthase-1/2/3 large subunit
VIHVDVDKAEIGKVRRPEVGILADCRLAVEALVEEISASGPLEPSRLAPWIARIRIWQAKYPLTYDRPDLTSASAVSTAEGGRPTLKPQYVIEALRAATPKVTILVSGVGQHQMWAAQFWTFDQPNAWINSGGLGTMGFAVPAAIGAKVGRPDRMVWAIDGDGCFQMTASQLVTASTERIPVKIAILNNAYLGMVRQWQHMFYDERYSEVYLSSDLPDYVGWANSMGCVGMRVDNIDEITPAIERANSIDDRPVVIDFRTDSMEQVFPMVPAGAPNDDIVVHPSQRERTAEVSQ